MTLSLPPSLDVARLETASELGRVGHMGAPLERESDKGKRDGASTLDALPAWGGGR